MKKLFTVLSFALVTLQVSADVARPSNINVVPPTADVPAACAAFSSEKGWVKGMWGKVLPTELYVLEINKDCTAKVIYAWGKSPSGAFNPGYMEQKVDIKDGELKVVIQSSFPKTVATFRLRGNELEGVYRRDENNRESVFLATLQRGS